MKSLAVRVYQELVRGRTTVRMHQASWPPPQIELNFLLGLYRSGTTPLRYSIGTHESVAAPPESDFLVPFLQASVDERAQRGLHFMGFDRDHVDAAYRQAASYFFSAYAESLGPEHTMVFDKSPRYVEHAHALLALFPEARVIVLVRHPFGQIGSATKYLQHVPEVPDFPVVESDLLQTAGDYWVERTQTLTSVLAAQKERALLVRYEDLCVEPALHLRRIASHLGLSEEQELVDYGAGRFDRGLEGSKALAHTQFEASMADPIRGWSEAHASDLSRLWSITGPLAETLGYERSELS